MEKEKEVLAAERTKRTEKQHLTNKKNHALLIPRQKAPRQWEPFTEPQGIHLISLHSI